MRHRHRIAIALFGAVLLVGGCGGDDGGGEGNRAATPAATAEPEATATETPAATPEAGATPEEGAAAEAEPIAEQSVKARGARRTTIDLGVVSLTVQGKLATLTVSYAVRSPEAEPDAAFSLFELNGGEGLHVTLVDPVNLKRYYVVEDSDGHALETDDVATDVPVDGSTTAQYTFAAPPADVTEIDVYVGDWPPFRDVPIQR